MIELRLHKELYAAPALDEALQTYARFATLAKSEEGAHWLVRIEGKSPSRERQVAGELGNYVLGLTVRSRKSR